jgi:hypothetical protein
MAKEVVSGEIDWNEADLPSPKGGGKSDYMRLKEGENVVRIMGNPVQTYIHWVTLPDGTQRKIVSPSNSPALVKKLEEAGLGGRLATTHRAHGQSRPMDRIACLSRYRLG